MKQGWEIKKLKDVILEIKDGGTPSRSKPEYFGGNVNWCVVKDILPEIYSTKETLSELGLSKCSAKVWPINSVIISLGATIGQVGIAKIPVSTKQGISGIIVNEKLLKPELLVYYLNFKKEFIQKAATGATIKEIRPTKLAEILEFPLPPLPEQQRIVSILDEAFAAIAKAKANAEQNLKNAKELFESYLQGVFENGNWETKTIEMVCDEIFAGGDAPKNNYSLEPNEKHNIPIYANAVKDRGLYGYTDFARVTKPCVTIAARGSGTGHTELRNEHFLPIVRLIVCIPDTEQISNEFLKYTIDNLVIQRSGSAIPQLTVPMIKDYKIPVPTIEEQNLIIEKAETLKQQKENLESVYLQKIEGLEELKKSILQKAFAGELKTEKMELI
jgi:type I restriction enzyme S subunit